MAYKIPLSQYAKKLLKVGGVMEASAIRGLQSSAYYLQGMAIEQIKDTKPYPPEDTGELVRSVDVELIDKGAVVEFNAPHASFMEYGTRPHFPPLDPIAEWVRRKGIATSEEEARKIARSICKKISQRGIEPRHYMSRAVADFKRRGIATKEIKREIIATGILIPKKSKK